MLDYEKSNVRLARNLRKDMTPWERKLWYLFLKDYPIRFQRQKPIGAYIVDFYCAKAKLALELDGSGHYSEEQVKHDSDRTERLENMGVHVIRIPNNEITDNFRGACEMIDLAVKQRMAER